MTPTGYSNYKRTDPCRQAAFLQLTTSVTKTLHNFTLVFFLNINIRFLRLLNNAVDFTENNLGRDTASSNPSGA